jgi:hypothetical protein
MNKGKDSTNQYGLTRDIPDPVKRQVRKECGFGCVTCGKAIAQYEHIDPEFKDAHEHDASKIAYLCGACHDNVTRGFWSKDKIQKARQNPVTFKNGNSKDFFDVSPPFFLEIGTVLIEGVNNFFVFGEGKPTEHSNFDKLLYIEPAEEVDAPFMITGRFFDSDGKLIATIDKNELIMPNDLWDVEIIGREFTIRKKLGDFAIQLIVEPPHKFKITRMNMLYRGVKICLSPQGDLVVINNGSYPSVYSDLSMRANTAFYFSV